MDKRLPIPKDWQAFERICHRLWSDIWADPSAQLNGRSGQSQNGVDVFGINFYDQKTCGIQCKDKDGLLGSELKEAELLAECGKARSFRPRIASFVMATTAPRDAHIQKMANEINANRDEPFRVNIWSWNDIEAEILWRPSIMKVALIPWKIFRQALRMDRLRKSGAVTVETVDHQVLDRKAPCCA